jgi:hypothetical protein
MSAAAQPPCAPAAHETGVRRSRCARFAPPRGESRARARVEDDWPSTSSGSPLPAWLTDGSIRDRAAVSPPVARLLLQAWRSHARVGSRRPTQTGLRSRTGISSALPPALQCAARVRDQRAGPLVERTLVALHGLGRGGRAVQSVVSGCHSGRSSASGWRPRPRSMLPSPAHRGQATPSASGWSEGQV